MVWGLRDYNLESIVFGGSDSCDHDFEIEEHKNPLDRGGKGQFDGGDNLGTNMGTEVTMKGHESGYCSKCYAWSGCLGLEDNPHHFIEHLVELFELLKPKLRQDASCYINIGDTYFGGGGGDYGKSLDTIKDKGVHTTNFTGRVKQSNWLQDRQLLMIPARFVIAMQERGWVLRNQNIWWKPNPMPSSTKSRRNNVYEMVYHFVKNTKSLWCYNEHTKVMMDRKPKELIEGRDWGWRECPVCKNTNEIEKRTTKIPADSKLGFGSPRARYHNVAKKKDCKRCGGIGRVKQSYWHNYHYFFDLDSIRVPVKDTEHYKTSIFSDKRIKETDMNTKRKIKDLNIDSVIGYDSKYEKSEYGQTLQGFVRTQSIARGRQESRIEAKKSFPDSPKKQQEHINFINDHDGHLSGRNPGDILKFNCSKEEQDRLISRYDSKYIEDSKASNERSLSAYRNKMRESGLPESNPIGRNPGDILRITTQPYKEAHFACVSEDTEILTLEGWKKYTELNYKQHKKVATYNLEKKVIEYQPIQYIREYDFDGELIHVGNRDLDILMTSNHRNVVLKTTTSSKALGRKRYKKECIVNADRLAYMDKIRVRADVIYPENNGIGKTFAELIGWVISEGHYKEKNQIELYQNEGVNAKRIDYLLKKLEISHSRNVRRINQVVWYLKKSPLVEWIRNNIPNKKLNKFIVSIPLNELKALYKGLINGDGHTRKDDGRMMFIQKDKNCIDWFQVLAMRLGYHCIISEYEDGDIYSGYLTKRIFIGIRNTNGKGKAINIVKYKGKIWCPKTLNGTWIARRNGRIFVTGNTFPEKLVEPLIESSCPREICAVCNKARVRVSEITREYKVKNVKGKSQLEGLESGMRYKDRYNAISETTGWTKCLCSEHKYEPGIVLDPFVGSGTTCLVASRLGRRSIGIDLNPEYIEMAKKRCSLNYVDIYSFESDKRIGVKRGLERWLNLG